MVQEWCDIAPRKPSRCRLWVERFRPETSGESDAEWEIYDAEGIYLGVVTIPLDSSPAPVLRNGRLAGVAYDARDVPHVVVFEVTEVGG